MGVLWHLSKHRGHVSTKRGGDINRFKGEADGDAAEIRKQVKEIKGIGDVGVGFFCDSVQAVWTCLAPCLDGRSFKTAEEVGLRKVMWLVQEFWGSEAVEENAVKMARLCGALVKVRLEEAS